MIRNIFIKIRQTVEETCRRRFPECARLAQHPAMSPSLSEFAPGLNPLIETELNGYENLASNLGGKSIDLLQFWDKQQTELPFLSKLAQEYLSIPASSTSCERIFSRFAPLVYDYKRNRFDAHTISRLISLQSLFRDL